MRSLLPKTLKMGGRETGGGGNDRIKEMVTTWTVKLFRGTGAQPHPFSETLTKHSIGDYVEKRI